MSRIDLRRYARQLLMFACVFTFAGCQSGPGGLFSGLSDAWNGSRQQTEDPEEQAEDVTTDEDEADDLAATVTEGAASSVGNSSGQQRGNVSSSPSLMRGAGGQGFGSGNGFGGFGSAGGGYSVGWSLGGGYPSGAGRPYGGQPGAFDPQSVGDVTVSDILSRQNGGSQSSPLGSLLTSSGSSFETDVDALADLVDADSSVAASAPSPSLGGGPGSGNPPLPFDNNVPAVNPSDLIVPIAKPESAPLVPTFPAGKPFDPGRFANSEPPSWTLLLAGIIALGGYRWLCARRRAGPPALVQ